MAAPETVRIADHSRTCHSHALGFQRFPHVLGIVVLHEGTEVIDPRRRIAGVPGTSKRKVGRSDGDVEPGRWILLSKKLRIENAAIEVRRRFGVRNGHSQMLEAGSTQR